MDSGVSEDLCDMGSYILKESTSSSKNSILTGILAPGTKTSTMSPLTAN